MKFRLRTMFGLITVIAIVIAVGLSIVKHRNLLRAHRAAFLAIENRVSSLDTKMREEILRIPIVAAQLQAANPVDPKMALSHSVMGESIAFGTYEFTRSFHYTWQLSDGSRCDGVKVTVDSVLNEGSFEDHVVRLTYETNELNDHIASWIEDQLSQDLQVEVRHNEVVRARAASPEVVGDGRAE